MFKTLAKLFPALNPFKLNTMEDIMIMDEEKTMKEKMQAEHVVRTHQFQIFMAEAKLNAMTEWRELDRENRKANQALSFGSDVKRK
jgi:hypothetical protein